MPATKVYRIAAATALVLAAPLSCSSTPPGAHPEDMSAKEHRAHSVDHQQQAGSAEQQYDPGATVVEQRDESGVRYGVKVYNPTAGFQRIAREHREHADAHAAAAVALESFTEGECADFPPETRKVCPLLGQVASSEPSDGGVRITLVEGANAEAVRAHVGCHLAFAAKQGFEGMDACPLYLKGVTLEPGAAGAALELKAADPALVAPLRARTATHSVQ
jgi:hypothetical protein